MKYKTTASASDLHRPVKLSDFEEKNKISANQNGAAFVLRFDMKSAPKTSVFHHGTSLFLKIVQVQREDLEKVDQSK